MHVWPFVTTVPSPWDSGSGLAHSFFIKSVVGRGIGLLKQGASENVGVIPTAARVYSAGIRLGRVQNMYVCAQGCVGKDTPRESGQ